MAARRSYVCLRRNGAKEGLATCFFDSFGGIQKSVTMLFSFVRLIQIVLLSLSFLALAGCKGEGQRRGTPGNGAFAKASAKDSPTLERIAQSGELIVGTISGPDTYFDYQGHGLGLQYALAEDFAATQGVAVRVETAADTLALVRMLEKGDIDVIALQLPSSYIGKNGLAAAGAADSKRGTSWAALASAADLCSALDDWYGEGVEVAAERTQKEWMKQRTIVRRQVRAPYISREKGIISTYDRLFREAARHTGWDWRLIAAQCYQESGFDPSAVSWAGAKGLMQIMPATAARLGLPSDRLADPVANVAAAARYIRQLEDRYASVRDASQRVRFVLAAYNAGPGHIDDARVLARKHGRDADRWEDVGFIVRNMSDPRYYRDPVVRHGYMIGSETYAYVEGIMARWQQYGGDPRRVGPPSLPASAPSSLSGEAPQHKRNRYSRQQHILSPDELAAQKSGAAE